MPGRKKEKKLPEAGKPIIKYKLNTDHKWTRWLLTDPQFSSAPQSCPTLCDSMNHTRPPCPSPTPRVHPNPCPSSRWCHPTISSSVVPFSPCPLSFQHQGLLKWFSSSHQVAKHWSFSFNISPSNEYSELISFRMDWLDLLAVQGTLKSLL